MSAPAERAAVFLDRDGTLIDDPGFLGDPSRVRLLPGVAAALVELERLGFLRVVITNQSGIGRGRYSRADFEATERELERLLALDGASVDAVYCCPHMPDAGCPCRKPGTALHREAIAAWGIAAKRSWCIGDRLRDVAPARELGCGAILVGAGHDREEVDAAIALGALVAPDLGAGIAALSR